MLFVILVIQRGRASLILIGKIKKLLWWGFGRRSQLGLNRQSSQLLIFNKLPNVVNMNKQFPTKNLAQSYVNNNTYIPMANPYHHQTYHPLRPNTHYTQHSPQKMSHSFIGPSRSQNSFDLRLGQVPPSRQIEQPSSNSYSRLDSKENVRTHNIIGGENVEVQYRVIENRMRQMESRIQRIQKGEKKGDLIAKNVEEMMRLQMRDIKCNQELEERLAILEDMMAYVKNTKMDRSQQENDQFLSKKYFQDQINELRRQEQANKEEIKDARERLYRLVGKIETTIVAVSNKYEQFIQRNIIKSIDQVNKLTHHYHEEIETFKQEQLKINSKMEQLIEKQANPKKTLNINTQLIAMALPNLKIIQSISLIDERKCMQTKEQFTNAKQSPKMIEFKGGLINSMYDSIEKTTQCSSTELLLQKITYKLDREFYLLDENDYYLLDNSDNRIRLSSEQIALLQNNNLIQ